MPSRPTRTSVDSLLRAVARTPRLRPPAPGLELSPGTVLGGTFAIERELGRGGMGVVYQAHDRTLDRAVAIKLLRADRFGAVPADELAALVEREGRVTARLQHPAIVTLYQLGQHDGAIYLVLELLRGAPLDHLLRRPLPPVDAAALVAQVADGVAHAHAQGVLHRDLKPHNIFVGDDGRPRILDFGLATLRSDGDGRASDRGGTPMYMAPEQRTGAPGDERIDVWALGLLLYQAATGFEPPPLTGPDDLAAPPWTEDLARLPPALAAVIRGCVAWSADARLPSARAVADALTAIAPAELVAPRRRRFGPIHGFAIASAVVAAGAVTWALWPRPPSAPPAAPAAPVALSIAIPPAEPFAVYQSAAVAVAPDGGEVAVVAGPGDTGHGASLLYRRRLAEDHLAPVAGTDDIEGPIYSPDGRALVYAKDGSLWRRALDGDDAVEIAPAAAGSRGVTMLDDGTVIYAPSWFSPLEIIDRAGGKPRPLTQLAADEKSHRFPHALPGGRTVLFVVSASTSTSFDDTRIDAVDVTTGARHPVAIGGAPRFVPPSTLLVPRDGTLVALPFDPRTATTTGAPRIVVDDLVTAPTNGAPMFDARGDTLAYFVGGPSLFATAIARVDAGGAATVLPGPAQATTAVRRLRDGRLLARVDGANASLWLHDLSRDTHVRISDRWDLDHPVLAPDGQHAYAVVTRGDAAEIQRIVLDGTGATEVIARGANPANLELSSDGRILLWDDRERPSATADLYWLDLEAGGPPRRYLDAPDHELQPALSPDGRWLAYAASGHGPAELYVQSFPTPGARVQVSTGGGVHPRWSADGATLYYRAGATLMASAITTEGDRVRAAPPVQRWSLADVDDPARRTFDLAPDGETLTVVRPPTWRPATQVRVIRGWQTP